ncbi:MAG TPA: hypothetical protein VMV31_04715 [Terriglobales bacterium]|nr:hypothetical protein [Terriglobales bacterium]
MGGKTTREQRLNFNSLTANAPAIARVVRSSWSVENRLHWCIDVALNDDQMRACTKAAAHNLAVLKHNPLKPIRLDPVKRKGGLDTRHPIVATCDL